MVPLKVSGEGDFLALFFQKYWHIVGDDVSRFCLDVLNRKIKVWSINNTNIVLLLKSISHHSYHNLSLSAYAI